MNALKNNIIYELIGLTTEIIKSKNPQIVGQTGIIINETKNMFQLKTKFGLKQIPKNYSTWKFFVDDNEITVDGKLLGKRPHDRLEIKA